ncbi:hypothetical protein J6TS2_13490 [Heyndrickxia sporothermodurans]|nr:hypothetical protein J6TS2_13490 [Heyndrickxia sporothermodurans]
MLAFASLDELQEAKERIEKLQSTYPRLFEKLVDVVHLTRALHFKYQFMGCLMMDENPKGFSPNFVQASVLRLYKKELQSLKSIENFNLLKKLFIDFNKVGYAKLSLLAIGENPESITGAPIIQ